MDLDLRLVRYFVTVADELHFGRAAAKLFISQPTLSKQIRKLETDVGGALLVRDSRHVALTPRGDRFLHLARQLLATADQMLREPAPHHLRIAHIFELDTGRVIADAFHTDHPGVRLVQSQLDSARQLTALLEDQLDVAIIRVTRAMKAAHPAGWQHQLLRLEPFRLVGRPGDPRRPAVSVHERPIEVFADAPGTALYNVHGRYLSSLEQHTGLGLRWLGNPGTFDTCHAALTRAPDSAYLLEFESYARRYEDLGIPTYRPQELQPVYPWSLAWRAGGRSEAVRAFLELAGELAARLHWLHPERAAGVPLWAPPEDLAVATG
ncbi:LysR family transcriptional regulator [Amycolatopsis mediterranei S699]|uniref:LysR family transcriptional regulator n=3 Tax=Amycolatopsis mediterranei TaxID=33910 RepID=A0A0H3D660_AMYMU|nr:LysR family transcriptional regulator [Amycolatopsis mediterranei]ADJ45792.1 LysR family transcriptional regulator [Amycolatopsis mediterranei U32]AEK42573.1 LysR family transcriptional regulator [Amycolatopsis mediterranei S699]AFO77503.1 LysR family transcriptional regulator [Amycolatopsis mediterranei S699]AGT84631.1 LysR family transcriptional regulator [Amycolatopsis mediterranei RB]KDO05328.1 LysR family transcriptional regulator [Amycolatopsis mediterranei]